MKKRYLIYQQAGYEMSCPPPPSNFSGWFRSSHIFRMAWYRIGRSIPSIRFSLYRLYKIVDFFPIATAGINHCSSTFRAMLREAVILERTVVLPRYRLEAKHNFGKSLIYSFDQYYDLSKSYGIYRGKKIPVNCISWSAYVGKGLFHCLSAYEIGARHWVTPKENQKTLIIRRTGNAPLQKWLYREKEMTDQVQIHLALKDELVQSAMRFVSRLGDYDALHFRKLERSWNVPSIYKNFIQDGELARQLPKVFKPGRRLFVMSNMHPPEDERFFSGLRDIYEIRRYTEEPELEKLAFGEFPDTQKLFLIEEQILKHAKKTLKVHWLNTKELQEILDMPSDQIADY